MRRKTKSIFDSNFEEIFDLRKRNHFLNKFDQIFRIYSLLGVLVAALSLLYFASTFFKVELSESQLTALGVAGAGVTLSVISKVFLLYRKQRKEQVEEILRVQSLEMFIFTWAKFEEISVYRLEKLGAKFNTISIREIIDQLVKKKMISLKDANELQDIMKIRNRVVHEGYSPHPTILDEKIKFLRSLALLVDN